MKYLIVLALFSVLVKAEGLTAEQLRMQRVLQLEKIIDKEFRVLKKVNKISKNKDPRMQYRLLELYAEKIRLLRERENKNFILGKAKSNKPRKSYFQVSKKYYLEALKLGQAMLKRFPRYKNRADIFYTLALNSRDYEKGNITEAYLLSAIRLGQKYSTKKQLVHNARGSLADYYYNEKKYRKAIPLYAKVIKNKRENWLTKYEFNLAWCLVKAKKHQLAIKMARNAFFNSQKTMYVNISDQVLNHIGLFYALGERVPEGIKFYIDHSKDPVPYLIKMSGMLVERGLFNLAEMTLNKSLPLAKNPEQKADVYMAMLNVHDEYRSLEKHHSVSQALFKHHQQHSLSKFQNDEIILKLTNFVSGIQKGFQNKTLRLSKKMERKFSFIVIDYFKMLSVYDAKDASKYFFHIAETFFSTELYAQAINTYRKAFDLAVKEKKNQSKQVKLLDSILVVLGETENDAKIQDAYLVWTYEKYLEILPKNKVSYEIYQKLYAYHFKKRNFSNARIVTERFHKFYPGDVKLQKEMVVQILDFYIEEKNAEELNKWIGKLNNLPFKFSKQFVLNTELSLGKILFDKAQILVDQGKKSLAAKSYKDLFDNSSYPEKIRSKSAYNSSLLYLEIGNSLQAYKMAQSSWSIAESKDLEKLLELNIAISDQFFRQQNFTNSYKIASKYFRYLCSKKSFVNLKEDLFKKTVSYSYINKKYNTSLNYYQMGKKCGVSNKVKKEIGYYLVDLSQGDSDNIFFSTYRKLKSYEYLKPLYFELLYARYVDSFVMKSSMVNISLSSELNNLKKSEALRLKSQLIDRYNAFLSYQKLNSQITSFKGLSFENSEIFDDKVFNSSLESLLKEVEFLTSETNKIVKLGHVESSISAYLNLMDVYKLAADSIININPKGKAPEFVKSFKLSMNQLAQTLFNKGIGFRENALQVIKDSNSASEIGHKLLSKYQLSLKARYTSLEKARLARL